MNNGGRNGLNFLPDLVGNAIRARSRLLGGYNCVLDMFLFQTPATIISANADGLEVKRILTQPRPILAQVHTFFLKYFPLMRPKYICEVIRVGGKAVRRVHDAQ